MQKCPMWQKADFNIFLRLCNYFVIIGVVGALVLYDDVYGGARALREQTHRS